MPKYVVLSRNGNNITISYCFGADYPQYLVNYLNETCDRICMEAFLDRRYTGNAFSVGVTHTMTFLDVGNMPRIKNAANHIAKLLNVKLQLAIA